MSIRQAYALCLLVVLCVGGALGVIASVVGTPVWMYAVVGVVSNGTGMCIGHILTRAHILHAAKSLW